MLPKERAGMSLREAQGWLSLENHSSFFIPLIAAVRDLQSLEEAAFQSLIQTEVSVYTPGKGVYLHLEVKHWWIHLPYKSRKPFLTHFEEMSSDTRSQQKGLI